MYVDLPTEQAGPVETKAGVNQCYFGDSREVLKRLIADGVKVQTCITSPPYWGLRDYGTATWEDGDAECDHQEPISLRRDSPGGFHNSTSRGTQPATIAVARQYRDRCGKCGAKRIDSQLGLEPTLAEFVANIVEVFALVREVLADDGVLWLNLGDSYAQTTIRHRGGCGDGGSRGPTFLKPFSTVVSGLKPKDLCGVPWRVAFALQEAGWWLRQDIIWHKPNPMPESVTDRCTKAHEYVFMLTKSAKYFFDNEAIAEPLARPDEALRKTPGRFGGADKHVEAGKQSRLHSGNEYLGTSTGTRNKRSVWTVTPQPYKGSHFATFPEKLIEPMVLAGSRPGDTVLDPFFGSGTTGQVAQRHGRNWIGIELNQAYGELQIKRLAA